jgi:beta-glucosidase
LQGSLESITLLKNQDRQLPLDPAKVKIVAVIGPNAYPAVTGGGGSSQAQAFEPVSTVTGVANLLGPGVSVLYSRGLPDMMDVFRGTHWVSGVSAATFPSSDFTGTPTTSNAANVADWNPQQWGPEDANPRTIRYTATFKADKAGRYLLLAAASGPDAFKVLIDGKENLSQTRADDQAPQSTLLDLTAGQTINVVADYSPHIVGSRFGLGIAYESDLVSADAKQFAAAADAVILAIGFNADTEGEGHDRSFALPWGQDALVEAVAAANRHTIVTLNGGGAMNVTRWIDKVPALLHTFYPGQEGGTAVAQVIFGKHNPEGKLPMSFDRTWDESPSARWYYPVKGADTSLHVTETGRPPIDYPIAHLNYGDRLLVGYRYWTTTGKHPLYPFGFGLSYTTFSFANLKVPATAASGETVPVSFDVTNTGSVAGAEVAQLYVSDPSATVSRPERELKGFAKVNLAPGETRHVTLNLDARAFSYWSPTANKWTIDPGKFVIRVGDSSENTPLHADLRIN